jgi:predicted Rossmann fold nucleotide-binding protein DprA/Smf involved in DNA uptake
MLTSHLSDPQSKPLTVAQLRTLAARVRQSERNPEQRNLTPEDLKALGYGSADAQRIWSLLNREEELEYYVNQAKKANCVPLTRISSHYPEALRRCFGYDSPGCLWTKGNQTLFQRPAVALVGSRDLRTENREFAAQVGAQAAKQGFALVSGNARGADQTAQQACLQAGGQVISVVADSLAKCKEDPNILYVSEDGFDRSFSAQRALSRNRIIHALGAITLVAQCSLEKGGTWNGTQQNLRQGWSPVCCFRDGSPAAAALEQMGAALVNLDDLKDLDALSKNRICLFP